MPWAIPLRGLGVYKRIEQIELVELLACECVSPMLDRFIRLCSCGSSTLSSIDSASEGRRLLHGLLQAAR